ncbi:MAG TPA: response regulator, partial [Candidatus Paraprevotella stercorigallinarum]|nr:response regulator [Candidatus Paraprevotella stercorigallinarum]
VKEYATLHDGKVTVESDPGKGTVFTVYVPTDLKGQPEAEDAPLSSGEEMHEWNDENNVHETQLRKKILVVEDNKDFRLFLVSQLNKEFEVMEASDGAEGEEKAIAENPDIIVSDLMMPQVDGMELCRRIKHNIKTSHIPFILLTARSSDSVQVEGYEAGIDSYISKPFNFDILLVRIRKLIEQQEKRKELFHKTIVISPSTITTTSLDEDLVKRALVSVEKNMDNADYTIEDLGRDLGLSRAHLNRKLQSIVELTPLQFIRSIRLKRAAQLLQDSQYNVAEIADMVGFNTLRYFNKYFKDEFHMTPTQYREEHKNKA